MRQDFPNHNPASEDWFCSRYRDISFNQFLLIFNKIVVKVINSVGDFINVVLIPAWFRRMSGHEKILKNTTATCNLSLLLNVHKIHTRLRRHSQYRQILGNPNQHYRDSTAVPIEDGKENWMTRRTLLLNKADDRENDGKRESQRMCCLNDRAESLECLFLNPAWRMCSRKLPVGKLIRVISLLLFFIIR